MRYHTTTRTVLDNNGKQIGFEQVDVPFTAEEEAEADVREAEHAAEAPKIAIRNQIAALESQVTPRRLHEAVLGEDNGWLREIRNKIADLRSQL